MNVASAALNGRGWQQRSALAVYVAIIVTLCGLVFTADLLTENTGMEVWIFYLAPLMFSLSGRWPTLPLAVAAVCSGLVIGSYFTEPFRYLTLTNVANRAFMVVSLWLVGAIAWQLIRSRRLLANQHWSRTGQNNLSARLRGEQSIATLADGILSFLAGYLDARVGALYVTTGPDADLERVATYAMMSDPATDRLARREGLVGQAATGDHCLCVRTPPGYLNIASATGQSPPGEVVVVPARADGILYAVVELGFLEPVPERVAELLESAAGSIGIAIRSAFYRRRLEELLEETRRQAELLQAQQEELRAANEELEEQRDRLQESEQALQGQQSELRRTNRELEEQTEALEQQKAELIDAQESLSEKASELARTSRYKSEFLANMSHELRTPLNSSLILAKLLSENREDNLTAQQVEFAETIHDAGNELLALIDDILDLSRIEAGKLQVQPERIAVVRLIETLNGTFKPVADQKGLEWTVTVEDDAPTMLETDPRRLLQVLKNLLSNAFKFTDEGTVSLDVSARGDAVCFSVSDTGIGIPESEHDGVFEAFRQADGTTNRRYGGTGLGLSISRELVHLLGGRIELESTPGRGSTFHVELPVALMAVAEPDWSALAGDPARVSGREHRVRRDDRGRAAGGEDQAPRTEVTWDDRERLDDRGRTILVIEDDEPFARILYDLAHEQGFQCLVAASADDGVALARSRRPSAIVLDIGLPDGSGLTVLERVKRDSSTRHIPVHVISVVDHSDTALAMGAVAYILKPASREQLVEAFQRLDAKLRQTEKRVLVVEDDPAERQAIVHLLEADNVDIVAVARAEEALGHLRCNTFDCMVTDLHLPDASNGEILERIAADDACCVPAGDRLYGPRAHSGRGTATAAPVALDHHQGRTVSGAAARRGHAVPAPGGIRASPPNGSGCCVMSANREELFEGSDDPSRRGRRSKSVRSEQHPRAHWRARGGREERSRGAPATGADDRRST